MWLFNNVNEHLWQLQQLMTIPVTNFLLMSFPVKAEIVKKNLKVISLGAKIPTIPEGVHSISPYGLSNYQATGSSSVVYSTQHEKVWEREKNVQQMQKPVEKDLGTFKGAFITGSQVCERNVTEEKKVRSPTHMKSAQITQKKEDEESRDELYRRFSLRLYLITFILAVPGMLFKLCLKDV
ncbi:hypothetical protein DFH28DRAFT_932101 [Melampsora americana]|nr:hypothetical protein DFH28DRAFT_932101 [Melampsora americana]